MKKESLETQIWDKVILKSYFWRFIGELMGMIG